MCSKSNFVSLLAIYVLVLNTLILPARAEEMRVRDLPIPEGASDVTYVKRRGDVRFQMMASFKSVGSDYAKKLAEQQWTKSAKDNLQRNFWVQHFAKGDLMLEVRVDSSGSDGCEVRLTPKGLLWDEDGQPTPKDLPLPQDAKQIEFDDFFETIEFKSAADVKTVANFLTEQLGKRNWTKAATEFDLETFVRMKFTQGTSSLAIDVRAEDTGCEVSITTKGMQWDGIKEENERAENEAKDAEDADNDDSPDDDSPDSDSSDEESDRPTELPKRKEKPKQGIEKLEKLASEATIEMNGNTFKLTSIIAYEVVEDGQWATKILATQRPIKQETLLARLKKRRHGQRPGRNFAQLAAAVPADQVGRR